MIYFEDVIKNLKEFWQKKGCLIAESIDLEVGAGTFHPLTFLRSIDRDPWNVAYVQSSRRPTDGRYADNPLRMRRYYQFQVIVKPSPKDIKNTYVASLEHIGLDLSKHDIRFVEDDWESPTLGASGLGWEVWLDSLEITQFTYFQKMGQIDLELTPCEITYGLERIAMYLQGCSDVYKIKWNKSITYGDLYKREEVEYSSFNFELADTGKLFERFNIYESEASRLAENKMLYPAYEHMLKTSHVFNILDARGAISVNERANYIARIRKLAVMMAKIYYGENGKKEK